MSWTYSGDPSTSPLDQIRFLIGDTTDTNPMMQNEEIEYWLAEAQNDTKQAALACLTTLLTKAAHEVNYTIGPEQVAAGERYERLASLKKQLENAWQRTTISIGEALPPTHSPIFNIGMMDAPCSRSQM